MFPEPPPVDESSEPTPEERALKIAEELAYDMFTRPGAKRNYSFRFGNKTLMLDLMAGLPARREDYAMYIAVNPPGELCSCCNGSGKRKAQKA